MKGLLLTVCSFLLLVSCQLPKDVSARIDAAALRPEAEATRFMKIGLQAPTWEAHKTALFENGAQELELDDVYYSARTNQKVLALTFDDGPHPTHTPRLLDILKERNAKCTFFVVGNMARNRTSILRRIVAEGHEIANHTVKHDNLARYSNSALRAELTAAHQMIVAATGIPPRMMRPPGGAITKDQRKLMLKEFGYPTIMWSCDPEDWKKPGVSVVTDRLIKGAKPGGILLLHDLHGPTIDAVPRTLDTLIAQGYRFITMSELIALDQRPESSGQ